MSNRVQKAYDLALLFHKEQKDKVGADYILHPIYVAGQLNEESEKIVALLHDTLEDTTATLDDFDFLTSEEKEALVCITKKENDNYDDYIARVKNNPLARKVKIEDLKHNLMENRGFKNTPEKIEKYKQSLKFLQDD